MVTLKLDFIWWFWLSDLKGDMNIYQTQKLFTQSLFVSESIPAYYENVSPGNKLDFNPKYSGPCPLK